MRDTVEIELIKPGYKLFPFESYTDMLIRVEREARRCYKSEKSTDPAKFIRKLLNHKPPHESPIEHAMLSVEFIVDRGITHEQVRHRIASYSQESTRYVDYSGNCQYIIPCWLDLKPGKYIYTDYDGLVIYNSDIEALNRGSLLEAGEDEMFFVRSTCRATSDYIHARNELKWSPQKARAVLPHSTKSEIGVTCNIREWRHIVNLRSAKNCHPQMVEIMQSLKQRLAKDYPAFFADIATPIL